MGSELSILLLYGLVIVLVILAQVTLAVPQLGLGYLSTARDEGRELTGVAARLERATTNCVIGMVLFAPVVLVLIATGASTAGTLLAAQVFLIARVIYVLLYAAGVPWLRTVTWVVALLATVYMYLVAL